MKECRIVHINDGNEEIIRNSDRLFVEELTCTERVIAEYLNAGFEVKHIIPDVSPAIQEAGNFTFYKGGVTVYFEREYRDDDTDDAIISSIRNMDVCAPEDLGYNEEDFELEDIGFDELSDDDE